MRRLRVPLLAVVAIAGCLFPSLDGLESGDSGADATGDAFDADAGSEAGIVTYYDTVRSDSPAMYLRFGELAGPVAVDSTGDNNGGTYPDGGITYRVPGAIVNDSNTAVGFDGVASVTIDPSFDFSGASPFTIEVWANQTAYEGYGFTIDHEDWTNERNGWDMLFATTYFGAERWNGGTTSGSHTQTDAALSLGAWHHTVTTFDGAAFCIYLDGVQSDCNAFAGTMIPSTGIAWAIGATRGCTSPCSDGFIGALDEFALYTHALSAARIAAHYHVGSGM